MIMEDFKHHAEEILRLIAEEKRDFEWTKSGPVPLKVLSDFMEKQTPKTLETNMRIRDLSLEMAYFVGLHNDENSETTEATSTAYMTNLSELNRRRMEDFQSNEGGEK